MASTGSPPDDPPGAGRPIRRTALRVAIAAGVVLTAGIAVFGLVDVLGGRTGRPSGPTPADQAQVEAVRRFVQTDSRWLATGIAGPGFGGRIYCGVEMLGWSTDATELYAWIACDEYYAKDSLAEQGTGVTVPVRFTAHGHGADTVVARWDLPGDGAAYTPMVRRLFPPEIANRIFTRPPAPDRSTEQLRSAAEADLASGLLRPTGS
ncbi:MAG: hypothetical protein HYR62_04875 [Actinobacteria bacterium]|nr:hypothetical protein [Actinomycetota bacterium]